MTTCQDVDVTSLEHNRWEVRWLPCFTFLFRFSDMYPRVLVFRRDVVPSSSGNGAEHETISQWRSVGSLNIGIVKFIVAYLVKTYCIVWNPKFMAVFTRALFWLRWLHVPHPALIFFSVLFQYHPQTTPRYVCCVFYLKFSRPFAVFFPTRATCTALSFSVV
jgi:hypothetical protein